MDTVPLGEIALKVDYGLTASADRDSEGPKFLRITDLQDGRIDWDTVPRADCTSEAAEKYRVAPGDLFFARTGATTGKCYLVSSPPGQAVFASYLIRVRPNQRADSRYLAHFFTSDQYWGQIDRMAEGAAQPGVNASKLKKLAVPLPPLAEQKRIAKILDAADALRAKRRESLAQLDALLQSTFLEMFGDPVENPKGWGKQPLSELADHFCDGPFGSNLKSSHYVAEGVRVLRLQNIGVGELLEDDLAFIAEEHFQSLPRNHCKPGDVIIGTLGDPNLRACVVPEYLDRALNKADCLLFRPNLEVVLSSYVCWLLNCEALVGSASGLVRGQTRGRISLGRLKTLPVPVPPIRTQQIFDAAVGTMQKHKQTLVIQGVELEGLFHSLQQRAFSGKL